MPDNLTKRHQPDRSKINMSEDYEVKYWTHALGVSKEELQKVSTRSVILRLLFAKNSASKSRYRLDRPKL